MNARIRKLSQGLELVRSGRIPADTTKARLMTESFRETEGQPQVVRCAHAFAHVLANAPIFIEDGELVVGNPATRPWGVELSHLWSTWPAAEIESLQTAGFQFTHDGPAELQSLNDYWRGKGLTARMTQRYDDRRLWPYAQLGVVLPPFRSKEEGWGPGGMMGGGYGIHHEISQIIMAPDFGPMLNQGSESIIAAAEEELRNTRLFSAEAVKKADLLRSIVIAHKAIIGFSGRFADLATSTADREQDPVRRRELECIAQACAWVPGRPARSFYEAIQSFWFTFLMLTPSGVMSLGRFDQYMYPFYRRDRDEGSITDEAVLELLECLRIKDSQITVTAGQTHRTKYGGAAKWHNCTIGGQTIDGSDATNELTYLLIDAARDCPTPHFTLSLRVHDGTPPELLLKAIDVVRSGLGMPAFIGDRSFIQYLVNEGVDLQQARDYVVTGCNSVGLPGGSRMVACPMFTAPRVLEFALNDGADPRTGQQVGPSTGTFESFATFDAFISAFKIQLEHFMGLQAEFNNVTMRSYAELYPQPVETSLTVDGISSGVDILERTMPFENGQGLNVIGMTNVADSMAAIKQLVFDKQFVRAEELPAALSSNWAGERNAEIRELCLQAPKFGNDDDLVDRIAAELYTFWATVAARFETPYGGKVKPSALTIGTSHIPGGALTGATPDGRMAGEPLASASMSPMSGRDRCGPAAVLASALKIDQSIFQTTELDLKFHPDALDSEADRQGFAELVMDYFRRGGKHIQLNVVANESLRSAQQNPEAHRDLVVRLGGNSSYFVQLESRVQEDVIARTEHRSLDHV